MLYQATYMIRPMVFVVQVWSDTSDHPPVRMVAGLKDRDKLIDEVRASFYAEAGSYNASFLKADPSHMAKMLPGVFRKVTHPETGMKQDLFSVIMSLNDNHGWTREKIADWIESLDDPPKFGGPVPTENATTNLSEDFW